MSLRLLSNERMSRTKTAAVRINPSLKRLTLNKPGFNLVCAKQGKDVGYVQLLIDDAKTNSFWVRPCMEADTNSKKLEQPSPGTRSFSITALLKELDLHLDKNTSLDFAWDDGVSAGRVDFR